MGSREEASTEERRVMAGDTSWASAVSRALSRCPPVSFLGLTAAARRSGAQRVVSLAWEAS
jgi:hypothetical protein